MVFGSNLIISVAVVAAGVVGFGNAAPAVELEDFTAGNVGDRQLNQELAKDFMGADYSPADRILNTQSNLETNLKTKLTLRPDHISSSAGLYAQFCVGKSATENLFHSQEGIGGNFNLRWQYDERVGQPPPDMDIFDQLSNELNFVDFTSVDLPAFQADLAYIVLPFDSFQPFATIAHEYTDRDDDGRMGVGIGARWIISKNATFGTQIINFPASPNSDSDAFQHHETRLLTRLEISF